MGGDGWLIRDRPSDWEVTPEGSALVAKYRWGPKIAAHLIKNCIQLMMVELQKDSGLLLLMNKSIYNTHQNKE